MSDFVELRLIDPNLVTVHGILPFQKGDLFLHLNEPGSGAVETALDIDSAALVESGGFVDVNYRDGARGGFFIENPARAEANAQEQAGRALTISGRGALALLDDAIVWTDSAGANTRKFDGTQAGMLIALIDEAKARGGLSILTYDFTSVNDSNSVAWTDDFPLEMTAGTSLLDVVRQIAKTGIDFEILPDGSGNFVLSAYKGGVGSDKSETIFFRVGVNCQEVGDEEAGGDIRNALLVKFKNGFTTATDATSIAARRRREKSVNYEYAQSSASATTLAGAELELKKNPRKQISVKIYDGKGPRVFEDYVLGDTITLDNQGVETTYRIRGIHLSWTDHEYADVIVDLNSMILENEIRITQDVDWLMNQWDTAHDAGLLEVRTWMAIGKPTDTITSINALLLDGDDLYVAGRLEQIGAVASRGFAKLNIATGVWTAMATNLSLPTTQTIISSICKIGSDIYIGEYDGDVWKLSGGAWTRIGEADDFEPGIFSDVLSMATDGTNLYVGGNFITFEGVAGTAGVAKYTVATDTWSALATGITANAVYALLWNGSTLYAGGDFTSYVKSWNGSNWATVGAGLDGIVYALAMYGTNLLAGGAFTGKISEFGSSAWAVVGGGLNNTVRGLAVYLTDIYATGLFTDAGSRIARYSGGSWWQLEEGLDNTGYAVVIHGTTVYVGGLFTTAGQVPVKMIAAYFTNFEELIDSLANSGGGFDLAGAIHNATAKTTMESSDEFGIWDSVTSLLRKITWSNILLSIKTYTDGLYVALTGNQTIAGIKTFTSFPITPSSAPTTDYQTANKKYVDDNGGASPTFTPGKIIISDATTGVLAEDAGFDWVAASKEIRVIADGLSSGFLQTAYGSTFAPYFSFLKADGSLGTPTNVKDDQVIGRIRARGYDGTTMSNTRAEIRFIADGDFSGTSHPIRIELWTTPVGSVTLTLAATIGSDGNVNIESGKTYNIAGSPHTHAAGDVTSGIIAAERIIVPSSIGPTTANQTAAVNTRYFANVSGMTANRQFILPTAATGDVIELNITVGNSNYAFIVIGTATVTINFGSSATEWSRLFIAGETIKLVATSTTNWQVVHDGRIPCKCRVQATTTQTFTNITTGIVDYDTTIEDNANMATLAGSPDGITIRRSNSYAISSSLQMNIATYARLLGNVTIYGGGEITRAETSGNTYESLVFVTQTYPLVTGNKLVTSVYQSSGGNRDTIANTCHMEALEIL